MADVKASEVCASRQNILPVREDPTAVLII